MRLKRKFAYLTVTLTMAIALVAAQAVPAVAGSASNQGGCCSGSGYRCVQVSKAEKSVAANQGQAQMTVCYNWNVLAYGGVVFNITHGASYANLNYGEVAQVRGSYVYYFTYRSAYFGNTSNYGGYHVETWVYFCWQNPTGGCYATDVVDFTIQIYMDGGWRLSWTNLNNDMNWN